MKIGVNLLLWTSRLGRQHLDVLRLLKRLGYDGVEVPVIVGAPPEYAELGRMLAGEGLAVAVAGTLKAGANPLAEDPFARAAGMDHMSYLIDCAHALRAEVIAGPIYQPLAQFSGHPLTEDEWGRMVESQQAMCDIAGPGLRLSAEPLNRFECYALNTAQTAARLVRDVARNNYGYLFDTFHAHIEERDPVAALAETAAHVTHFHVSENDRGTPGRGHAAIAPALRALKASGYDQWISVEAFGQALPDVAAATRVWRPLFTSETEAVQEGIALIRNIWNQ